MLGVNVGDVFCLEVVGDLIVIDRDPRKARAKCIQAGTGRCTWIQESRLLYSYDRACEKRSNAAHRRLAVLKEKASRILAPKKQKAQHAR